MTCREHRKLLRLVGSAPSLVSLNLLSGQHLCALVGPLEHDCILPLMTFGCHLDKALGIPYHGGLAHGLHRLILRVEHWPSHHTSKISLQHRTSCNCRMISGATCERLKVAVMVVLLRFAVLRVIIGMPIIFEGNQDPVQGEGM